MTYNIAVIKGDGIGPDIITEAIKVLDLIGKKYNYQFNYTEVLAGGASIDAYGIPLTEEVLNLCKHSDSVLLGAVGGPKWDHLDGHLRPEKALLGLRSGLGLYANLRPAILYDELKEACPLKESIIGDDGLDIMVVRELTGGLYFGKRSTSVDNNLRVASDEMVYNEEEIRRIAVTAFEIAKKRNNKITSVDKANILDTSRLWRKVVEEVHKDYKDVVLEHMFVDNAAMQLVRNPKQFDVILTENMFGDILSDEASMITGSIGMLPSASLGTGSCGMYEPIHGSAPDIAGLNLANPIATILSAAMMLRHSFNLHKEADEIEAAVKQVLSQGYRTKDIISDNKKLVGTSEMGNLILSALEGIY